MAILGKPAEEQIEIERKILEKFSKILGPRIENISVGNPK